MDVNNSKSAHRYEYVKVFGTSLADLHAEVSIEHLHCLVLNSFQHFLTAGRRVWRSAPQRFFAAL